MVWRGSEALAVLHRTTAGNPSLDLDLEVKVQVLCRSLIGRGIVKSAHDVSHGGMAVAVAESAIQGEIGVTIDCDAPVTDWLAALFGEGQSRIVLSCAAMDVEGILLAASDAGVPATRVGTVGGDALRVAGLIEVPLEEVADVWLGAFERVATG